jgi:hypothetical protein
MHNLEHKTICKLHNYSYLFIQEQHGDPFCKFFLIYDYCEQSISNQLKKLKAAKGFLTQEQIIKLIYTLCESSLFLNQQNIDFSIRLKNIFLDENENYKIQILDNSSSWRD